MADVAIVPAPNEIKRESGVAADRHHLQRRRAATSAAWPARSRRRCERVTFDRGYHPEFLGEYAARQESRSRLLALSAACRCWASCCCSTSTFSSWRLTLLVFLTLPFALIGGVLGAWLARRRAVARLARRLRHGAGHRRPQRHHAGQPLPASGAGGEGTVRPGTGHARRRRSGLADPDDRLATGLALVPLVVAGNRPGHEIEYPLAVVILGGLVTSTLLNLLFLPPLYAALAKHSVGKRRGDLLGTFEK